MELFLSLEREPPALQVGEKEFYLCPENKPPDDRLQTGSPTVYKLAQREVIRMDMVIIAQSPCDRQQAISIAAEQFVQKKDIRCTF